MTTAASIRERRAGESAGGEATRTTDVTVAGGGGADEPRRRRNARLRLAAAHAVVGFVAGYAVVHPVAMSVFAWFAGRGTDAVGGVVLHHLVDSFTLGMVPMGLAFGLFGLVVGALDGYHRSLVRLQRDDLASQLAVNRESRRQIEEQYRALRELEAEKRRMTQFLVHDLKNHVGCVLGYADLLARRGRRDGWRARDLEGLDIVRRQAKRMQGEVRDLLALARLEHRAPLRPDRVNVARLLRQGVTAAALGPGEGVVEIGDVQPSGLDVECDPALVERVLANLVLNAVRHNGTDVEVRVEAVAVGDEVHVRCADTGGGIPEEVRGRLFEEFVSGADRGEPESREPSFGLGLAFCKAAVEAHRGRIWFETNEGRGTTFVVALPSVQYEEAT